MRSRAGPAGALFLCLLIFAMAFLNTACATVAKVGGVLHAAGNTISAVGDVLIDGAAGDLKSGTDAVGITEPAPAPAPKPQPAPPEASPEAMAPVGDSLLPLAPMKRPCGLLSPSPGLFKPARAGPDLDLSSSFRPPSGLFCRT